MASTRTKTETREYTVTAAAVTVATGRIDPSTRKPEVVRLLRGETINAEPGNLTIRSLLASRGVIPSDRIDPERGLPQVTTRTVYLASKNAGEATAKVNREVVPLDAPKTELPPADPNALTTADL